MIYSTPISYGKVVVHLSVNKKYDYIQVSCLKKKTIIFKYLVFYVFEFKTVTMLELLIVFVFDQS